MKLTALFLCFSAVFAKADLPAISEDKNWLGYFTAWDDRRFDYGYGDDGKGIMHIMKGREERIGYAEFVVYYRIQEHMHGKWVNRALLDEGGLTSESKGGVNPDEPVSVLVSVKGGTKAEFLMTKSDGKMIVKPKLIEKTTDNPIRIAVELKVPNFFPRLDADAKERKKLMRSDFFEAVRAADGEEVKVKLYEDETDLLGEDFLEKGALSIEFFSKKMEGQSIMIAQGSEKTGVLELEPKKPFYEGMEVLWIPDQEKLGEKDCYVTFWVE